MAARAKGLRLKARWRIARATVRTLIWVSFALLLVTGFFVKTALGHRVVLGWGLGQVQNRVAGSLDVDVIRSANLLRGARLIGVRLTTPDGRPFVEADSVEASYSVGGLLRGALVFDGIRVWGPHVVLDRDSTGSDTFDRWLRGDAPPVEGGGGLSLRLEGIGITNGSFALRMPVEPVDSAGLFRTEVGPDARPRRALDVRGIDAHVSRVELGPEIGIEVDVGRATAEVDLLAQRFDLEEFWAEVRVRDGRVFADLRRFRAPGVLGAGTVVVDLSGEDGSVIDLEAALSEADLREWMWVRSGIPPLEGSLDVRGRLEPGLQRWTANDVDARWEGGRLRGRATAIVTSQAALQDVALDVRDLPLLVFGPYLSEPLPVEGTLTGRFGASGPVDRLLLDGDLTLATAEGEPVRAVFAGGVNTGERIGLRAFRATLEPFDFGLIGRFAPAVRLRGPGRVVVEGTGDMAQGLRFTADLTHRPSGAGVSHVLLSGSVLESDDLIRLDVQGDLSPLSLDALVLDYPELPLSGTLTGPVRARGILRDLEVRADLMTPEGDVELVGRLNARDPGARYELEATVADFLVSALTPIVPDPTRVTGRLALTGSGLDPATLVASGRLDLGLSDVRGVRVDSAHVAARIEGGQLRLDTLRAGVAGFEITGDGTLAADTAGPAGQLQLAFETPSLQGIRAYFRGDEVLTADDLTALDWTEPAAERSRSHARTMTESRRASRSVDALVSCSSW